MTFSKTIILILLLILPVIFNVLLVTKTFSATIKNEVISVTSTGGNITSSSTEVKTGSSKSSVNVTTLGDAVNSKVEVGSEDGYSMVEVKSSTTLLKNGTTSSQDIKAKVTNIDNKAKVEIESSDSNVEIVINSEKIRIPDGKGGVKIEINGFDPIKKEITIKPKEVNDTKQLEEFSKAIVANEQRIKNVRIASTSLSVEFISNAKLFGFIPSGLNTVISVDTSLEEQTGRIKVKYPWHHFFFKKETNSSNLSNNIELEIKKWQIEEVSKKSVRIAILLQSVSNAIKSRHDIAKSTE